MTRMALTRLNIALGLAVVLLAAGLIIEGTVAKPRLRRLQALDAERTRLMGEIDQQRHIEAEGRTAAALLGIDSLDEVAGMERSDPIAYLGSLIEASGLMRLGLNTDDRDVAGTLDHQRFTLRVRGDYRALQDFVQRVESGPRLAAVDAFTISPDMDGKDLEGRFNLSIYDAGGVR